MRHLQKSYSTVKEREILFYAVKPKYCSTFLGLYSLGLIHPRCLLYTKEGGVPDDTQASPRCVISLVILVESNLLLKLYKARVEYCIQQNLNFLLYMDAHLFQQIFTDSLLCLPYTNTGENWIFPVLADLQVQEIEREAETLKKKR